MRKWSKLWSWVFIIGAMSLIAVPDSAFASKPRSSSRSRASKPRASKPRASKPRVSSKAKTSKKSGSSKKGWGSSSKKKGVSKPKKTRAQAKADVAAYEKSKASGKAFGNRKSAMTSFKKNNTAKYKSSYTSEPTSRPGHIPQTTMVGGNRTTIIYNQSGGGYGYMNTLGTFMLYNAMADMAMRPYYDRQMMSAGYHIGPRPVVPGYGFGTIFGSMCVIGLVVIVIVVVMRKG